MANIIDVAKHAGVSIATVSRVINQSGYVSASTRERVMASIQTLDFSPSVLGRNLLQRRTEIVAVYVQNLVNPFFASLLNAIDRELRNRNYHTLLLNAASDDAESPNYLKVLSDGRVDGLILISDAMLADIITKELPIVSLDRHFSHTPWVSSDNYDGGRLAANHLFHKGCRNVAFVGDDALRHEQLISEVSRRKDGFVDQVSHYVDMRVKVIEYPKGTQDEVIDLYLTKLVNDMSIDGVFCISDMLAFRLLGIAKRLNRPVPESLKVVGYDGVTPYFHTSFALTSVTQPLPQLANALVETLFGRIEGQVTRRTKQISVYLRQGQST